MVSASAAAPCPAPAAVSHRITLHRGHCTRHFAIPLLTITPCHPGACGNREFSGDGAQRACAGPSAASARCRRAPAPPAAQVCRRYRANPRRRDHVSRTRPGLGRSANLSGGPRRPPAGAAPFVGAPSPG
ncbi:hypothetical protein EVAR_10092_1 [Eumeta japonica]|uniref:Uncharacterized protein n=1 Tax=Eumeta variegata TaxID=151549 RepID=A0A4C1UC26_EUMVA|nr:hypothetical protein EVAR_10092_1 [Eumeta japonica]